MKGQDHTTTKRRIIVVDEHLAFSESLALFLRRQDYEVATFSTLPGAVQAVQEVPTHIALCDMHLSHSGLFELVEQMSAACPTCRLVLLGPAEDLSAAMRNSQRSGCHVYAHTKPVYPAALLSKLDLMLADI